MHESKDPAIKLFGKNIPLPSDDETTAVSGDVVVVVVDRDETGTENKDYIAEEKESSPKTPSIDEEKPSPATAPATMKKPEKILRCPRCNSMDTKFCYFNNYNVNQPRHFCKSCQRYWTSGGSMRNVPVGAGRRKSKPSAAPPPPPEYSPVPLPLPRLGCPWVPLPPSPTAAAAPFYPFWWVPPPLPPPPPAKRPRDQEGGKVLVPKTLRIDDPAEAAKSSIWAALGICSGDDGVGMFGGFRKKSKECFVVDDSKKKKNDNENDLIRAANPAALSRSINFHETS